MGISNQLIPPVCVTSELFHFEKEAFFSSIVALPAFIATTLEVQVLLDT